MNSKRCRACTIVVALILFLACSEKKSGQTSAPPLKLVFVATCVNEDFFGPVKKGMQDAAALVGVDCAFTGTEDVDVVSQVEMVRSAIKNGVDGIAVSIIDTLAFDEVIQEAIDKKIPVVAFNCDDNRTKNARLSAVAQNLYKAGQDFAIRISPLVQPNSTALVTLHSEGISALDDRLKGMRDGLKDKNITFKVAITGTKADSAATVIAAALKSNPDIAAVFCTGLADTEGAGIALEKPVHGKQILAAGFDLSPVVIQHIRSGRLAFTIDQQPYMQGFLPVLQLAHYRRYGIIPSNNEIGATFVSKENVEEVEKLIHQGYR